MFKTLTSRLVWGISRATAALLVGGLAAGVVLFAATPACAHVTVNPTQAVKGGYAVLTFRVPNEDGEAATTKLEVSIDASTPIPNGRIKPIPGWDAKVETRTLDKPIVTHHGQYTDAVATITWTAREGSAIKPGEFGEFDVSFGPFPDADRVVFKALQTYDNGRVVRWIDENPEADNPAPVLKLVKGSGDHHEDGKASDDHDSDARGSDSDVSSVSIIAMILGGVGLIVAIAALLIAARSASRSTKSADS